MARLLIEECLTLTQIKWAQESGENNPLVNCGLSVFEYIQLFTNKDHPLLGTRPTAQSSLRVMVTEFNSDLTLMSEALALYSGMKETHQPQRGCVGVLQWPEGLGKVCGIYLGRTWMVRANRGFVASERNFIKAWEFT